MSSAVFEKVAVLFWGGDSFKRSQLSELKFLYFFGHRPVIDEFLNTEYEQNTSYR
jgi:hypothetical protein